MRRIAVGSVLALGLILGSGSAAFAGEYRGHGGVLGDNPGGDKARSVCSFSGQDQPDSVEDNGPNGEGNDDDITIHGTQNFGQIVAMFGYPGFGPGTACNPNSAEE